MTDRQVTGTGTGTGNNNIYGIQEDPEKVSFFPPIEFRNFASATDRYNQFTLHFGRVKTQTLLVLLGYIENKMRQK